MTSCLLRLLVLTNEGKERGADTLTATSFDSQMSNQFGKRVVKSYFLIMNFWKYCNQRLRNAIKLFNWCVAVFFFGICDLSKRQYSDQLGHTEVCWACVFTPWKFSRSVSLKYLDYFWIKYSYAAQPCIFWKNLSGIKTTKLKPVLHKLSWAFRNRKNPIFSLPARILFWHDFIAQYDIFFGNWGKRHGTRMKTKRLQFGTLKLAKQKSEK